MKIIKYFFILLFFCGCEKLVDFDKSNLYNLPDGATEGDAQLCLRNPDCNDQLACTIDECYTFASQGDGTLTSQCYYQHQDNVCFSNDLIKEAGCVIYDSCNPQLYNELHSIGTVGDDNYTFYNSGQISDRTILQIYTQNDNDRNVYMINNTDDQSLVDRSGCVYVGDNNLCDTIINNEFGNGEADGELAKQHILGSGLRGFCDPISPTDPETLCSVDCIRSEVHSYCGDSYEFSSGKCILQNGDERDNDNDLFPSIQCKLAGETDQIYDCDDTSNSISTSSNERCFNRVDDNCNLMIDEGCINTTNITDGYFDNWKYLNSEGEILLAIGTGITNYKNYFFMGGAYRNPSYFKMSYSNKSVNISSIQDIKIFEDVTVDTYGMNIGYLYNKPYLLISSKRGNVIIPLDEQSDVPLDSDNPIFILAKRPGDDSNQHTYYSVIQNGYLYTTGPERLLSIYDLRQIDQTEIGTKQIEILPFIEIPLQFPFIEEAESDELSGAFSGAVSIYNSRAIVSSGSVLYLVNLEDINFPFIEDYITIYDLGAVVDDSMSYLIGASVVNIGEVSGNGTQKGYLFIASINKGIYKIEILEKDNKMSFNIDKDNNNYYPFVSCSGSECTNSFGTITDVHVVPYANENTTELIGLASFFDYGPAIIRHMERPGQAVHCPDTTIFPDDRDTNSCESDVNITTPYFYFPILRSGECLNNNDMPAFDDQCGGIATINNFISISDENNNQHLVGMILSLYSVHFIGPDL